MTDSPMDLIEKYLERVRLYLPPGSEDQLTEMRTHLIEEAQNLGRGQITHGAALLAIERFGDPRDAANAYARLGKKVGPIPTEYVGLLTRIVLILVALSCAFLVGAYVVGAALITHVPDVLVFLPDIGLSITVIIIFCLLYAAVIISGMSILDRKRPPTEKTTIEQILGVGVSAFRPSARWESMCGFVATAIFALVLSLPAVQLSFTESFRPLLTSGIILIALAAIHELLQFWVGENNVILTLEATISAAWVVLAFFLINFRFPLDYVWVVSDGVWSLVSVESLIAEAPALLYILTTIWIGVIFLIVVTSMWDMVLSAAKVTMHMKQGRGWWWRGEWSPEPDILDRIRKWWTRGSDQPKRPD